MRTIAHISDLHFGREDPPVVEGLLRDLAAGRPGLVAVSGDLTQRARRGEFEAARAFLDRIEAPRLVVPGNHDIPLFDVFSRLLRPLASYRKHIDMNTDPFFTDGALAVLGVNTARSGLWKGGRLAERQLDVIRARFCDLPGSVFKILVTHHPFVPGPHGEDDDTVRRGALGLAAAEACGVDMLLAGHLHHGFAEDVRGHHETIRRSMLVVQAGTAVSRRTRREPNTYNWIIIDPPRVTIESRAWDGTAFAPTSTTVFEKRTDEWQAD